MSNNISYDAMMFARLMHKDQRRKYSGNLYADHLAEVAGIAATASGNYYMLPHDIVSAVCWLHFWKREPPP